MTDRVYRSAQGKVVDLGALVLRNESVRAAGNMNINARGDLIDSLDRPIQTRPQQMRQHYDRQTSRHVNHNPVQSSKGPK
jgi:hypothetical protein